MAKRFANTFFCRERQENLLVGHHYGIAEDQSIPAGFEIGEILEVYYHRQSELQAEEDTGGFGIEKIVLAEDTFSGPKLELPSGITLAEQEVCSCYRYDGPEIDLGRGDA